MRTMLSRIRTREKYLIIYAVILAAGAGITLAAGVPQPWAVLVVATVALTAAWVSARIACRQARRRLHRLREAVDALARGDLATCIDHPPDDDFLKLSDSVERVLDQLRENYREHERLRRQLTHSEKLALIGELAATVAHEVNNPLDGLQNSIRILRRGVDNPDQVRQLLDLMENGLYRIEMIMRRLLTMSRDEPLSLAATRIETIVDDALVFAQPKLNRGRVELIRDLPESLPFAMVDRLQMAQVLINLMINAADAMPNGGKLTIRCRSGDYGRTLLLDVIDTGCGIAPEHLPHIFEPFYTTKSKGGGTGLGLAVVSRIVKAHGGTVEIQSEVGKGTRFRISLPVAANLEKHICELPAVSDLIGEHRTLNSPKPTS
ncbi:MAG: sensor histidine kinase [Phycisphaerae bacterium]